MIYKKNRPSEQQLKRINHLSNSLMSGVQKRSSSLRDLVAEIKYKEDVPDPEPTIVIDPAKINVIKLDSNKQRTTDVQYFDTSADASTYLREAASTDRFDVLYGDDCTISTINLEYNTSSDSDHKAFEVIHELYLGTGVKSISRQAFQESSIEILRCAPNSVTTIYDSAFGGCASLSQLILPTTSLMYIGDNAFSGTLSLTNISLPSCLQALGNNCFYLPTNGWTITRTLTFGEDGHLSAIPNYAFANNKFDALTIPDYVQAIGTGAFAMDIASATPEMYTGCVSLTIGDGVTTISANAFAQNRLMTTLTIGTSVTTIGSKAFEFLASLSSLTIPASVTTLADDSFDGLGDSVIHDGGTVSVTINQAEDNITSTNITAWKNSEYYTLTWTG